MPQVVFQVKLDNNFVKLVVSFFLLFRKLKSQIIFQLTTKLSSRFIKGVVLILFLNLSSNYSSKNSNTHKLVTNSKTMFFVYNFPQNPLVYRAFRLIFISLKYMLLYTSKPNFKNIGPLYETYRVNGIKYICIDCNGWRFYLHLGSIKQKIIRPEGTMPPKTIASFL